MRAHSHHLRNYRFAGPLNAEDLSKLLQVMSRSFTDGEDGVSEPTHAQRTQLLVEELNSELASEKGDVLDDSEPNSPLLVLRKLHDGR